MEYLSNENEFDKIMQSEILKYENILKHTVVLTNKIGGRYYPPLFNAPNLLGKAQAPIINKGKNSLHIEVEGETNRHITVGFSNGSRNLVPTQGFSVGIFDGNYKIDIGLNKNYLGVVFCLEPTAEENRLLNNGEEIEEIEVVLRFEFTNTNL